MNPEQENIEQQNHVVNPEMLEPTSLRQVEQMGGITEEKQAEIMNPAPAVEAPHIKEEKVAEIKKSIFAQFKERIFGNKEDEFTKDMKTKIKAWAGQGAIEDPSDSDINMIIEEARADKFEGKVGNANGKLTYRKSSDIKWGTGGHNFGSGE